MESPSFGEWSAAHGALQTTGAAQDHDRQHANDVTDYAGYGLAALSEMSLIPAAALQLVDRTMVQASSPMHAAGSRIVLVVEVLDKPSRAMSSLRIAPIPHLAHRRQFRDGGDMLLRQVRSCHELPSRRPYH